MARQNCASTRERFAPFTIHPLPEIDWARQIPQKGDRRQMETWQRLGTYTAGLALEDAGLKADEALCRVDGHGYRRRRRRAG